MATCPHCYVGLCKKHLMQDGGRREKTLLGAKAELQKRLYDTLVKPKMDKLAIDKKANSAEEVNKYKKDVQADRDKSKKKKSKYTADQIKRLQSSGLRGDVLAHMIQNESDSESNISDLEKGRRKSKKKDKDREKKKKLKDKKRDREKEKEKKRRKKDKKREKEREREKKRKRESREASSASPSSSSTSSDSSSDSSSSDDEAEDGRRKKRRRTNDDRDSVTSRRTNDDKESLISSRPDWRLGDSSMDEAVADILEGEEVNVENGKGTAAMEGGETRRKRDIGELSNL